MVWIAVRASPKELLMKNMTLVVLALWFGFNALPQSVLAQVPEANSVRCCEAALAFAAGAIQKTTPRDGIVNLITGDNQTTGDRMILGRLDVLYLKLDHPSDAAIGDLYTVYRRVRKVFHPVTGVYLGFSTIRLAVVKVTQVDSDLTTVEVVRSFNALSPGDLVMRFTPPPVIEEVIPTSDSEISGMIVELQADKTMTLVSQSDVVYLDRGRIDGLKAGDLMDVYRRSAGLARAKDRPTENPVHGRRDCDREDREGQHPCDERGSVQADRLRGASCATARKCVGTVE